MYISNTGIALFVYGLSSPESISELRNVYHEVQPSLPEGCKIILVGNKSDIQNPEVTNKDAENS
jgi:GTPase SAR1 family protein